jgi:hypothetical protein
VQAHGRGKCAVNAYERKQDPGPTSCITSFCTALRRWEGCNRHAEERPCKTCKCKALVPEPRQATNGISQVTRKTRPWGQGNNCTASWICMWVGGWGDETMPASDAQVTSHARGLCLNPVGLVVMHCQPADGYLPPQAEALYGGTMTRATTLQHCMQGCCGGEAIGRSACLWPGSLRDDPFRRRCRSDCRWRPKLTVRRLQSLTATMKQWSRTTSGTCREGP